MTQIVVGNRVVTPNADSGTVIAKAEVQEPGKRGGKFHYDKQGKVSYKDKPTDWQTHAQAYLGRLAGEEYHAGLKAHVKAGRKAHTYRHNPSEYHRTLVEHLGRNDENAFKAHKMMHGYHSAVGV